jgi:hypothetical protein
MYLHDTSAAPSAAATAAVLPGAATVLPAAPAQALHVYAYAAPPPPLPPPVALALSSEAGAAGGIGVSLTDDADGDATPAFRAAPWTPSLSEHHAAAAAAAVAAHGGSVERNASARAAEEDAEAFASTSSSSVAAAAADASHPIDADEEAPDDAAWPDAVRAGEAAEASLAALALRGGAPPGNATAADAFRTDAPWALPQPGFAVANASAVAAQTLLLPPPPPPPLPAPPDTGASWPEGVTPWLPDEDEQAAPADAAHDGSGEGGGAASTHEREHIIGAHAAREARPDDRLSGAAAWLAVATDQGGAVRTTVRRRLRGSGEGEQEAACAAGGTC